MPSTRTRRIESDLPVHPRGLLVEELEARGITQKRLAEAMGRPPQVISEIVNGKKAITAETALQLERVLDIPAHFWMNLQTDHDLTVARLATEHERLAASLPKPGAG